MSDSGGKEEIEEVLSSVRRLVSTGNRPAPEGAATAGVTPHAGDRLVLSPSLRVDAAQRPAEEDAAAPQEGAKALKARIAELEEIVARQNDQWDPDNALSHANSGGPVAPLPWADDLEGGTGSDDDRTARQGAPATGSAVDATSGNAGAEQRAAAADAVNGLLADGGDTLDEDALRDLVADIVRQELQGALGERITRNVRKLVRREIHRALDSQGL